MSAIETFSPDGLSGLSHRVSAVIQHGGIVAIPTETFYGLGVDPFDEEAVERLLRLKGKRDDKPILVLVGSIEQLPRLVKVVPPVAKILMDAFWPGPLTILFPALPSVPANLTANTGTVGIRLSSCEPLIALLRKVGPLTGTSANRSDRPPARTAQMVQEEFNNDVDLIIDAGTTPGGSASTVIDGCQPVRVIREGAVTRRMLQRVLEARGISLAEN
ncbi:L-threonylcarbamoyladenylate synthase [Petrachloros mirabilis]